MSAEARSWLLVVSAAAAVLTMAIQAVVPAVPALGQALDLSASELGWFTTAYLVPTVILTVPSGLMSARLGPRPVFAAALIVYAAAGVAQGMLESYGAILVLRVVQGACFAVAMPATIALLADTFAGRQQLRAFSVREVSLTAAGVAWPLLGTGLATISWQAPFFAQGLMFVVALAFLALSPPDEGRARERRPPPTGTIGALRAERLSFNVMLLAFGRYFFRFVIVTFAPVLIVISGDGSLALAGVLVAIVAAASAVSAATLDRLLATTTAAQLALLSCVAYCVGLFGIGLAGDSWWVLVPGIAFGFGDGVLAVLSDLYAARLWRVEARVQILAVSQTFRNLGKLMAPVAMSLLVLVMDVRSAFYVAGAMAIPFLFGLVPLRAVDERVGHAGQA